jgi:hypothetical protein
VWQAPYILASDQHKAFWIHRVRIGAQPKHFAALRLRSVGSSVAQWFDFIAYLSLSASGYLQCIGQFSFDSSSSLVLLDWADQWALESSGPRTFPFLDVIALFLHLLLRRSSGRLVQVVDWLPISLGNSWRGSSLAR